MPLVRFLARPFLAGLLAAAIGVSGAAACADEWQSEQAEMACCKTMREACAKRTSVVNCCQTQRDGHQKATAVVASALSKTSTQHLISISVVESISVAAPAVRIAPSTDS